MALANSKVIELILRGKDQTGGASKSAANNLQKVAAVAKTVAATLLTIQTARFFSNLIKEEIDLQDQTAKLSRRLGVTVEDLSTLQHATALSGTSIDEFTVAMRRFNDSAVDASKGIKVSESAFQALGITVRDKATGALKDNLDLMFEVADAFAVMEDGARKSALAQDLFGKAGSSMIPLLNSGSAGIHKMQQEARELGLEMSTGTAKAAEEFNDNLQRLRSIGTGVSRQLTAEMLPALVQMSQGLLDNRQSLIFATQALGEFVKGVVTLVGWVGGGVEHLAKFSQALGVMTSGADFGAQVKSLQELQQEAEQAGASLGAMMQGGGEGPSFNFDSDVEEKRLQVTTQLIRMSQQYQNDQARGEAQLTGIRTVAHLDRLEQIRQLEKANQGLIEQGILDAQHFATARTIEEERYQWEATEAARTGAIARAEEVAAVEEFMYEGRMERLQEFLESENAEYLGKIEERREFAEAQMELLAIRQQGLLSLTAQLSTTFVNGFGNAFAQIATGAQKASDAFKDLGKQMLAMVAAYIGRRIAAFAVERAMAVAGLAIQKASATSAAASATGLAAAWTIPAVLSLIATEGGSGASAALLPGILVANQALATSLTLGGTLGQAHDGLDSVPRTGSYILEKGETVVPTGLSNELRDGLREGFSGQRQAPTNVNVVVQIDGRDLVGAVASAFKSGTLTVPSYAVRA